MYVFRPASLGDPRAISWRVVPIEGLHLMAAIGEKSAKTGREKSCGTAATLGGFPERFRHDPAKSIVMRHIGRLVSDGFAEWRVLDDAEIELRFVSGEVFLLAETTITRIA
jgi:hypothetical protein